MTKCPSENDLQDFRAGRLSEEDALRIESHVASCTECRRTLEAFTDSACNETQALDGGGSVPRAFSSGSKGAWQLAPESRLPQIDGYTITGVLGQGGMGVVYEAHQRKLNRRVALKVLPAIVGSANPAAVARFRREATAAARLHHTNIIPIYDFGESQDAYFYTMELVVGQPLSSLIEHLGARNASTQSATGVGDILKDAFVSQASTNDENPSESSFEISAIGLGSSTGLRGRAYYRLVARWIADAADALQYAHGEGIVHRDIKPSNLILSIDGRLMIADFGLAKNVEEQSMTTTGAFMGSLRYASPEQAMARRLPVDHRTDIYSLGATMYELLCFRQAIPGDNEKEVLAGVISRDPVPPRKHLPIVPVELETICQKAMEKSQDARYATARAFSEDLKRFLQDLPITAKRPGIPTRTLKFLRRHKLASLCIAASLVIAGIGASAMHQRARRHEAELRTAEEARNRREAELRSKLRNALSLVQMEQWEQAEQILRSALDAAPNNVDVLVYMIWMKTEQIKKKPELMSPENYQTIVDLCERTLKIAPNERRAQKYYSIALKNVGRYEDAIRVARRVVDDNPEEYDAWSNLGAYYALAGNLPECDRSMQQAISLVSKTSPDRSEDRSGVYRNYASLLLYRGDSQAKKWIDEAVKEQPTSVDARLLRIRMRLSLTPFVDVEEALQDAHFADQLANKGHPLGKRMLALTYLRVGEFEKAIAAARKALALGDQETVNHLIIAASYALLGDGRLAEENIRSAREVWPPRLKENSLLATFKRGFLWIESKQELDDLLKIAQRGAKGKT